MPLLFYFLGDLYFFWSQRHLTKAGMRLKKTCTSKKANGIQKNIIIIVLIIFIMVRDQSSLELKEPCNNYNT